LAGFFRPSGLNQAPQVGLDTVWIKLARIRQFDDLPQAQFILQAWIPFPVPVRSLFASVFIVIAGISIVTDQLQ
jgi:hypothetical protein